MTKSFVNSDVEEIVKSSYQKIALAMQNPVEGKSAACCSNDGSSCCSDVNSSRDEQSLGCDLRLLDIANPQTGEFVLDFGSGPGSDTRKVSEMVGDNGKVIGVDFLSEMIELAESKNPNPRVISYLQADLQNVPLGDNIADLIISNCVFNLVPSKSKVFEEAYRLLTSGGRIVISDMIATDTDVEVTESDYCACVGGAVSVEEYIKHMKSAGFEKIETIKEYESEFKGELNMIPYQSVIFIGYKP